MLILLVSVLIVNLIGASSADESVIPSKSEYERYLDQVLLVFNNDDKVKKILMGASTADIKNGIVERTLSRIHPDIRTKLDEVKRSIISEYKQKLKKAKLDDQIPKELYKFSDDDLKHLLKERQERLKSMDETRRKQFHKYELEKELKHKMMLRAMNEYDRKVQEAMDEENKDKRKQNQKKLPHPGNKKQIEEVWMNDGFDKGSFNPKTFFKLHDLNGDNEWDPYELEAIFEKEVEQLFEGLDDIDETEKSEEVARMREHVVKHLDTNEDGMVQIYEFLTFAKGKDFDHEDPWDTVFSETIPESEIADFEAKLDADEKKNLEKEAMEDKKNREAKIKEYEEESLKNQKMLKEHSEQLREAIAAANKARELADATKLVQQAAAKKKAEEDAQAVNQQEADTHRQKAVQQLEVQQQLDEQQRQQQVAVEQQRQAELQQQQQLAQEQQRQAEIQQQQIAEQQRQQQIALEQQQQLLIQQEQQRQAEIQQQQIAEQQRQQQLAEQQRQQQIVLEQQQQADQQQQQLLLEQQRKQQLAEQQRQQQLALELQELQRQQAQLAQQV